MIHFRAKISSVHLIFCGKSHVETGLTESGKNLAEPVKALAMTSSEQWHTYLVKQAKFTVCGHLMENAREEWPELGHTDISWLPSELIKFWPWSVDFPFWHNFDLVKQVKFGVSGNFIQNAWEEWLAIWHVDVSWLPFQLFIFRSWSVDFPYFGRNLT